MILSTDQLSKMYLQKNIKPEAIAAQIQQNWTLVMDNGMGAPQLITKALGKRLAVETNFLVKVHTILDVGPNPFYDENINKAVGVSWFSGQSARKSIARGQGDVMPCCYKDMATLFDEFVNIDAVLIIVSPMDAHGYFSTGIVGSNCELLLKKAKHIYLEVNPNMPRVASAPLVHISQITALCESKEQLLESSDAELDEVSRKIGVLIGAEVPNGATIQLGIGAIPNAVGEALKDKKDLGIHTELLTDKMIELIECGAVTNAQKPIHRDRTVAAFAFGTRKLYDYLDDNPAVEILPVYYVNEPQVIAQMPNFISVNAALQVDFWGQVCAESIGTYHVSGTGGQMDYVRGAVMSPGGRSYIAFPSTARDGTVSRIVPCLDMGAIVTTSKNEVDCIVTEYGIAALRGKTLKERTAALIAIAHPKFREVLLEEARARKIL